MTIDSSRQNGALSGLTVLDLTQLLAGPFCTMILADLGASVIKVEPPGGEMQRQTMRLTDDDDCSPAFMSVNRNKRGIVLDLKSPTDHGTLISLIRRADVMVENFRPGTTMKLGIDFASVHEVNPSLVYGSITGFGDHGPYADRPGIDLITQGMSGLMSVTGEEDGGPLKVGVPITDLAAGMFLASGLLAGVIGARETGKGVHVTTSLLDAGLALGVWEAMEYWTFGRVPRRTGTAHRLAAPQQVLRTADGHITVGAGADKLWARLPAAIGRPELATDPRFVTNHLRLENRVTLETELEATLATDTTAHWVDRLIAAGVPAGPILGYDQILEDTHMTANEMIYEFDHPTGGKVRTLGSPIKLAGVAARIEPAPTIGEHTAEVLAELDVTASEPKNG